MIVIEDPGQTLSTAQRAELAAKGQVYSFDIHVLIGTGAGSRAAFERQVTDYVGSNAHLVSIGVDPSRHFSFVHSSGQLGLPSGPQVAQAGNPFFRSGNLVEGIDAIASKARDLQTGTQVLQSQTGVPIVIHEHHTAAIVWWELAGILVLAIAVVGWFVWRARRRERAWRAAESEFKAEAQELRQRNIEEGEWHDRMAARQGSISPGPPLPYQPSSYRPVAPLAAAPVPSVVQVNTSGSSLDLLVGYEIGRDSVRSPSVVPDSDSSSWSAPSSSDSDSSSDWGSSDSDSSSSFDSGSDSGSSSGSDW